MEGESGMNHSYKWKCQKEKQYELEEGELRFLSIFIHIFKKYRDVGGSTVILQL